MRHGRRSISIRGGRRSLQLLGVAALSGLSGTGAAEYPMFSDGGWDGEAVEQQMARLERWLAEAAARWCWNWVLVRPSRPCGAWANSWAYR
jgi:hypothetical protein